MTVLSPRPPGGATLARRHARTRTDEDGVYERQARRPIIAESLRGGGTTGQGGCSEGAATGGVALLEGRGLTLSDVRTTNEPSDSHVIWPPARLETGLPEGSF